MKIYAQRCQAAPSIASRPFCLSCQLIPVKPGKQKSIDRKNPSREGDLWTFVEKRLRRAIGAIVELPERIDAQVRLFRIGLNTRFIRVNYLAALALDVFHDRHTAPIRRVVSERYLLAAHSLRAWWAALQTVSQFA